MWICLIWMGAKNSFTVNAKGQVSVGPLFLMEKHNAGFNKVSHNWQYTLIMPNGQTVGTTNGKGIGQILLRVPQFRGRGSGCDDVPARGNTRQLTPDLI
jgi:hypothetical protein